MGEEQTPQSILREAADVIDRALAKMDLRRYPPEVEQQLGKFINFAHAKAHMRFAETPRKLRREADFLDEADQLKRADDGALEERRPHATN